jgi:hypothetical protein
MNRWLRSAGWLVLGLALPGMAVADDAKWVSLFDGETLSGWEMFELGGKKGSSKWEVKDGALTGSGTASMLFSPKGEYKNFRYRAQIKINDHGNSGMYIRIPEKEGTFSKGYEIQINSTHGDPIKTGSIYTFVHIYKELVKPDTWFTQEIEAVDKNYRGQVIPHIKISVNGDVLYEFLDHTKSFHEGFFAFQQHDPGSVVQIRKVEVMELPDTPKK